MEFYVDTADLEAVKSVYDYYPIAGFTTNPNILTRATKPLEVLFGEYRDFVRETGLRLFVQVTAMDATGMLEQAVRLRNWFGDRLVVKLPAIKEGYRACKLCRQAGISVCVTVIHSSMQALMAAMAGADYVAPYISHIDNIGADGVRCVDEMVRSFKAAGLSCRVLGASFRTADQIERLAVVGCQAVTITPETFGLLIAHPSTDVSMTGFNGVWHEHFGDRQITDFLPEQ